MSVANMPTRFALIKRAEKILKNVDDYFEDATNYGLSIDDSDPDHLLRKIRIGIIDMLEREGRIRK